MPAVRAAPTASAWTGLEVLRVFGGAADRSYSVEGISSMTTVLVECPKCGGTGSSNTISGCSNCNATGYVTAVEEQTEPELVWETTLHFQQGSSDKVYSILIVREPPVNGGSLVGPLYRVCYAYGRRGGNLIQGNKETHQTWSTCARAHNGLLEQKLCKGYNLTRGGIVLSFTPLCQTLNPSPSLYKSFPELVKPGPLPLAPEPKNSTVKVNGQDFDTAGDVDIKPNLPHLPLTGAKKPQPIMLLGAAEVFQTKPTKAQQIKETRIANLKKKLAHLTGGKVDDVPTGSSAPHKPAQLPMNTGRKIVFEDE